MAIPLHESPEQKRAVGQMIDQTLDFINSIEQIKLPRIVIERDKGITYDSQDPDKQTIDDQTFKDLAKVRRAPQGSQVEGVSNIKVSVNAQVKLECKDGQVTTNQEVKIQLDVTATVGTPERAEHTPSHTPEQSKHIPNRTTEQSKHTSNRTPKPEQTNAPKLSSKEASTPTKPSSRSSPRSTQSTKENTASAGVGNKKEKTVDERVEKLTKSIQEYAHRAGKDVGVKGKVYNWSATPDGKIKIEKNGETVLERTDGKTTHKLSKSDLDHFEKAMKRVVKRERQSGR
ncbi:hypothetical protein [Coleofasciculus sp. E1-EBD-02]|jgi:hypothetical protein|uniref:hypothetical protein n=1 Tax=Coleofasciculus sp. E1-EBD-02 TaxID=3068481 RepID=UPI0032F9CBD1